MLQDGAPEIEDITAEEEDQLDWSTKKVKRDEDLVAIPDQQMSEADHVQETSGDKEDFSSMGLEETSDAQMEEAILETPTKKQVNRALWKPESGSNLSYKEKLLGFNGRNEGCMSDNEDDDWEKEMDIEEEQKAGNSASKTNPNGNPSIETASRFQAIAQLDEKGEDRVSVEEIVDDPPLRNDEMQTIDLEKPKQGDQNQGKARGVKVKNKRMEIGNITPKKAGVASQTSSDNPRKNAKQPHEKASDHTVVTSVGANRKQHAPAGPVKSPSRPSDNANKAVPKALTEVTRPKKKKPPDFNESLHLIKMAEKELSAPGTLLSDLGLTQVYDNRGAAAKSFPGLVKDIFNKYKVDILALYETRVSGDKASRIIKRCGIHNFIRIEADGYSGGIWILWKDENIQISLHDSAFQLAHCFIEKQGCPSFWGTFTYASPNPQVREFCWKKLESIAPVLASIEPIHPPNNQAGPDRIAWNHSCDGNFSIKTAYNFIMTRGSHNTRDPWKLIWKCPTLETVKVFLWTLGHDSIMTNVQRKRRNFCNSDICQLCGNEAETSLHALRDCNKVSNIWRNLLAREKWQEFFNSDIKDWLHSNLNDRHGDWNAKFAICCWCIWKRRSKVIFNNLPLETSSILEMTKIYMKSFREQKKMQSLGFPSSCDSTLLRAQSPYYRISTNSIV
ncbi:putative ribonuclease H protein At1g65750 family [Senna tora]|uniref:Putative ribonuclease H protein At1g65750 family n=1 Tax=Senna tora TaxID=362788 RepID=A0A834SG36_9FABA|nr:putative ribonuclease H protein At1g65750 family [Senna tora]